MPTMAGIAVPSVGKTVADYAASMTRGMQPILDLTSAVGRRQDDLVKSLAPTLQTVLTFTTPSSLLGQVPSVVTGLQNLADQQQVLDGITRALRGYAHSGVQNLKPGLLPSNLRERADEFDFGQVLEFLHEEAIPLYLVPKLKLRSGSSTRLIGRLGVRSSTTASTLWLMTARRCWRKWIVRTWRLRPSSCSTVWRPCAAGTPARPKHCSRSPSTH